MNKLPFLKPSGWPQKAKVIGEKTYGFSEDEQMLDIAIDEILEAFHSRDKKRLYQALSAIIAHFDSLGEDDAELS